jgi:putative transposase
MRTYNRDRRSIRLKEYDYSQCGYYFVTICIQHRECLLGEIYEGVFYGTPFGILVQEELSSLASNHPGTVLESWVVMPNHIHFIFEIKRRTSIVLGEVIRQFKYETTKQINIQRDSPGVKVWQRNYYEHIIRTDRAHQIIRQYIRQNPSKWNNDQLHPENPSKW